MSQNYVHATNTQYGANGFKTQRPIITNRSPAVHAEMVRMASSNPVYYSTPTHSPYQATYGDMVFIIFKIVFPSHLIFLY